jgi:hypothetical protein
MQNYKYAVGCLAFLLCINAGIAQATKQGKTQTENKTQTQVPAVQQKTPALQLGRYELYSGIPSMYLGHFVLLDNGKYKVAFDTDEDNYDVSGSYIFHADTQTIEWIGGMFKSNNWGGKLFKKESGYKIEFNKSTFGVNGAK